MKKIITLVILVLSVLTSIAQIEKVAYRGAFAPAPAAAWTDTWTEWDPQNKVYPSTTANPTGGTLVKVPASGSGTVITTNTTWSNKNTYIIAGLVYVKSGVTLTIEPGTTIFGSNQFANSSLIITKGAKLYANGKVDSPIVFTSMYPVGQRNPGDWGGIVLLGKAPYNGISSATSPTPNAFGLNYIEGITEVNNTVSGESTEFGGGTSPNVSDTSGSLKYVRIEYGGYIFSQNKEINGLTFGAVGKGTKIDYIQCSYINDDAFEWFGGNVNCTHLVAYRGIDDEFDTDNGFSGSVQYGLGIRDPRFADNSYNLSSGSSTSEGYESDNDANGSDNNPRTKALFTNMTHIGPLRGDNSSAMQSAIHPGFRRGARIRRNSELKIFNSIIADYPTGLMIDNSLGNSGQAFVDGRAKFKNNILSGVKSGALTETSGTMPTGFNARTYVLNNNNDSTLKASAFLTAPYGTDTTHTLATWSINSFKTADYRPKTWTGTDTSLAGYKADFTDSSFNNYGTVQCPTVAHPSAISGTSFSVTSATDTLKTFSVDSIAGVDAYIWGITGGASGNKIKSGFGTRSVTFIIKSLPATVFVSATNYCNQSDTSAKTIACSITPTAVSAITGAKNLIDCGTIQTYKVANPTLANKYRWSTTGTGNTLVSSAGDSATFAMVSAGSISATPYTDCSNGAAFTLTIVKTAVVAPVSITATPVILNVCSARVYRYSVPAIPTTATGYTWSLPTGSSLATSATLDSVSLTGANASVIKIKYSSNAAAGANDSIRVSYTYACGVTSTRALKLAIAVLNAPAAPASITVTKIADSACTIRYRYIAPAVLPAASTTAGAATGWQWSFTGTLGGNFVVDSGSLSSRIVRGYYTNLNAKTTGDSVKCRYNSSCGFGAYKTAALTNVKVSVPAAPASITVNALSVLNCTPRYRYIAPVLPAASTTASAATGWEWSFTGTLGANFVVDSGSLSTRIVTGYYTSGDAKATGDSVKCRYNSACGFGAYKAAALTNVKISAPAAPASLTVTKIADSACGQPRYRYIATSVLPAASTTASAATGWEWSFTGTLGAVFVVDSGSLSSNVVTGYYTSGAAKATGDSVKCRYTTACGFGAYKAAALTNTALGSSKPLAPLSISIAVVDTTICGGRIYRYTAPTLPAGTSVYAAATGYKWSLPSTDIGAVLDSGSLNGKVIRVSYTNNRAAITGDSIYVNYTTSFCGEGLVKAQKLSNLVKANCLIGSNRTYSRTINTNNGIIAQVFPNPNNGNFTLRIESGNTSNTPASIQIIDMNGRVVSNVSAVNNNGLIIAKINNSSLKNGFYIVKYTVGNVSNAVKMIIQK